MKQSDLFLQSEGDAFYERNKDKPRLPDPVIEAMQACQLQPRAVLELGCGNGWRLREIMLNYKPRPEHCMGYDASEEAIKNHVYYNIAQADILHALETTKSSFYDAIIFGFCLYLVDREDLMMIAAHTDRVLQDKGHIIIHDFFTPPNKQHKVKYKHKEGVWSYHWAYNLLWDNPHYKPIAPGQYLGEGKGGIAILQKDIAAGWPERAE